jgi:hypothetical protein
MLSVKILINGFILADGNWHATSSGQYSGRPLSDVKFMFHICSCQKHVAWQDIFHVLGGQKTARAHSASVSQ